MFVIQGGPKIRSFRVFFNYSRDLLYVGNHVVNLYWSVSESKHCSRAEDIVDELLLNITVVENIQFVVSVAKEILFVILHFELSFKVGMG